MNTVTGFFVWIWRWFWEHIHKIGELQGKKEAIAGGVALGFFVGFTPLFGIKTVLSMSLAWIFGCNVVAAAIAVTLHDVSWPILPALMLLEYDIGYWFLSHLSSQYFPPAGDHVLHNHGISQLLTLKFWQTIGLPVLIGSMVFGAVGSPISYYFTLSCLTGLEKRRNARKAIADDLMLQDEAEAEDLHHERKASLAVGARAADAKREVAEEKPGDGI